MTARHTAALIALALTLSTGCHPAHPPVPTSPSPPELAQAANKLFLNQKTYDPWVLTATDPNTTLPLYQGEGEDGWLFAADGRVEKHFKAGLYRDGRLVQVPADPRIDIFGPAQYAPGAYRQTLDMRTGKLTSNAFGGGPHVSGVYPASHRTLINWASTWQTSDVIIQGDPQAQQVTHANLFYLLSSTYPGSDHSIPPMGLSSDAYGGHIFWDAEVWMLPALIVQHPEYAKPIVDYRFKRLAQAKKNAKTHGFQGAEYPWESADTGQEVAPAEFAKERHITADVGFAAWQYFLWAGDKIYLAKEGWPLLQATAQYWSSRVTKAADGKYHIKGVLSPDETAGVVDDDIYTNAAVSYNLRAATEAAKLLGQPADPRWAQIADQIFLPMDTVRRIPAENTQPLTDRFRAKQADTLLLIHPLGVVFDAATQGRMLDFYSSHTSPAGPAMTSSIESVVAARLGRAQPSLDLFYDSYRPFMRGPWDAFSEKRTTNNVYFLTGMAGCVQSVLYGFAGLQAVSPWQRGVGRKLASDSGGALFCDPHLPPSWSGLAVMGVRFGGRTLDIRIAPGNVVTVTEPKPK